MLVVDIQTQTTTFWGLLYVPLGGGLPAAAGLLGPILAFLLTFLAGGLVFFRRGVGQALYAMTHDWRWATVALGLIAAVGGGAVIWLQG